MSACPFVSTSAWNHSATTERISVTIDISVLFENLSRKSKLRQNLARIAGTLREYLCTFVIVSHSVLLRMKNISHKSVGKSNILDV